MNLALKPRTGPGLRLSRTTGGPRLRRGCRRPTAEGPPEGCPPMLCAWDTAASRAGVGALLPVSSPGCWPSWVSLPGPLVAGPPPPGPLRALALPRVGSVGLGLLRALERAGDTVGPCPLGKVPTGPREVEDDFPTATRSPGLRPAHPASSGRYCWPLDGAVGGRRTTCTPSTRSSRRGWSTSSNQARRW